MRALPDVGDDVVDFEGRVRGQDDVGVQAVVLQPGMLATMHLDLGCAVRPRSVQLPWFQQVIRQGVSVQIMWILVPPFSLAMG